jgi:hypothetical protein
MHPILILMPVGGYGLLTLIFARSLTGRAIIEAHVKAHLAIFAFIALATEFISVLQSIALHGMVAVWSLFLLVCLTVAVARMHRKSQGFRLPARPSRTPPTVIFTGAIGFILAATLATAILYPPNTWDSMTYHMARVVNWINNGHVSFYPTAIMRQNYQMPLAEFAIMHLQVLTGADLFANLVQWMSFFVLIGLGVLTAAELGLDDRQQLIAATVLATLPMAILQASSTQNDLVVSSFVMSFGLFMLRLRTNLNVENLLFTSAALGLALLTKGTAYLFCAAIGLSLAVPILWGCRSNRAGLLKALGGLSTVVISALVLNAGHFTRNYTLYGHPLSTVGDYYQNQDMSAYALLTNIARNSALHLATSSHRINGHLESALHGVLGPRLNNPKTTLAGTSFGIQYSMHEDKAGNLIHILLALSSLFALPILWCQGRYKETVWYALGVFFAALIYCWILKWQPWASRLHTPLFVMAAPLLTLTITEGIKGCGKRFRHLVVLSMVFYSLLFVLANSSRSLVALDWYHKDRMKLYFTNRPQHFEDYANVIKLLPQSAPQEVGLYLGSDDWEYPFWALARQMGQKGNAITFRHVGIRNISKTLAENQFRPRYVVATKELGDWKHAAEYIPIYTSDDVSVFEKAAESNNRAAVRKGLTAKQ